MNIQKKTRSTRTESNKADVARWLCSIIDKLPESLDVERVSDWIERKMIITEGPAPGRYSFRRTPYLREIADNMSIQSNTIETAVIKGTQLGFSVVSFGVVAYNIDKGIGPQLFVSGDAEMAESAMERRLDPIIENAGLRDKIKPIIKKTSSKTTGDTKDTKTYAGTFLRAVGPNSESKLRSFPARISIVEEVDVFPQSVKQTGNPIEKIERRADSFGALRRMYFNSTPKAKSTSQIWPLVESGDMRKYMWTCPHCGHQQPFEWVGFGYDRNEHGAPDVAMDENGRVTKDPVYYECQNEKCKHHFTNADKYKLMLDRKAGGTAQWVPTKKTDRPGLRSYVAPAFISPFRSWLDIVLQYWRVKDDPLLYVDFVNDVLAEASDTTVAKPEPHFLMRRAEGWSRESSSVPTGVIFTTVQCDVQGDRLEAALLGWGHNREMWVLQYYTFFGDTSETDSNCWKELSAVIESDHKRDDGIDLGPPVIAFVDAGFNTTAVHYFCSQYPPVSTRYYWNGVYPVEGRDNLGNKYYRAFDCDIANPKIAINDQKFKHVLYAYVNKDRPQGGASFPTGYIHFPCDLSEDFYKQLVAEEQYEERQKNGKKVYRIENRKGRRNEALDIVKMGYASVYYLCMQWYEDINKKRRLQKKHELELSWPAFFDMMESRNQP